MIRDPEISALRTELEQLGVVVAPHRDHLCVRMPLFTSVRVRVDEEGRLACEAMFGPLRRMHAFLAGTTALTIAAGAALYTHAPVAPLLAFLAVMSGVASVCGFVLTENCITRVQLLWAARQRAGGEVGSSAVRPSTPAPMLRAAELSQPSVAASQLVATERRS